MKDVHSEVCRLECRQHRGAAAAMTVLLVGCTAGEPPRTGSSAEGLTVPRVYSLPKSSEHGPWRSFLPDWRHNLQAPSSNRPAWLPTLPENLPRIPVPDDGFRDNLAKLETGCTGQQIERLV